jgi:hypothetical protein
MVGIRNAYVPEPRVYTVNGATHRTIAAAAMTVAARPLSLLNLERLEAQDDAVRCTPIRVSQEHVLDDQGHR